MNVVSSRVRRRKVEDILWVVSGKGVRVQSVPGVWRGSGARARWANIESVVL